MTFFNIVLQALTCGTPVVATAVGGIPEQVKSLEHGAQSLGYPTYGPEEATGVLVSPGYAEVMAEAVVTLLTNETLHKRLAENAAQDAQERFDLPRQVDDYLNWYAEILRQR